MEGNTALIVWEEPSTLMLNLAALESAFTYHNFVTYEEMKENNEVKE